MRNHGTLCSYYLLQITVKSFLMIFDIVARERSASGVSYTFQIFNIITTYTFIFCIISFKVQCSGFNSEEH